MFFTIKHWIWISELNPYSIEYGFRINLETNFNFSGGIEFELKSSEKFAGIQFGEQKEYEISGEYHPAESFFTSFKYEKGEAIAYRIDQPEIGDSTQYNLFTVFRFSDNFKISLGHRYSELKNKITHEEFYAGEINRFEIDYQIDGALSTRTIIEKNDFSDDYFLEALIQWKPNPYTTKEENFYTNIDPDLLQTLKKLRILLFDSLPQTLSDDFSQSSEERVFHLQQQHLIELIREQKIEEALQYAAEHLAERGEEDRYADSPGILHSIWTIIFPRIFRFLSDFLEKKKNREKG